MIRSILAVIAGYATWTVIFLGGNQLLFALFKNRYRDDMSTDDGMVLLAALALSLLASIVAGWVTVAIAKAKPVPHTLALGVALLATGIPVQMSYWDSIPLWYNLCFLGLLLPASVLGGKLRGGS